jgi:hypothetical protein
MRSFAFGGELAELFHHPECHWAVNTPVLNDAGAARCLSLTHQGEGAHTALRTAGGDPTLAWIWILVVESCTSGGEGRYS